MSNPPLYGKSLRPGRVRAPQGDAAIALCKNEIASPPARNDIMTKGVRDTCEIASSHWSLVSGL